MSVKFLSDIEVKAGLRDSSGSLGASGQILSSTSGNVSWVTPTVNTVARDVQNEVKAGVAINKGQAVYVTGADGTNIIVGLASNTSEATSSKTLGLLNSTVAVNGFADVVQIGRLAGLNTIGATAGDPVWLGTNGNLIYGLINKPYAPAHLVFLGIVTRVNANNGEIFVNVQNGFELKEIHDVDIITNVPINGDVLGYDGTLWVNKTIAEWLGYTPANASGTTNYVSKFTGATTLGNSLIYDNGTNVGIGTATPSSLLEIAGSAPILTMNRTSGSFINTIDFKTGGSSVGSILSNAGNGEQRYSIGPSVGWGGYHTFYTDTSERMRITSGGNVLIGTTTDLGYKLRVAGASHSFNVVTAGAGIDLYSTGNFAPHYQSDFSWYTGAPGAGTFRARLDANGNFGIGTTSPSQKLDVNGFVRSINGFVGNSGLSLYGDNTSPSAGLFVTTNGNVGIGTTSPSYKLSIQGNAGIEASEEYFYFNSNYSIGSNARAKIRAVGAGGGSGYGGDFRISTRATNNAWNEDAFIVNSSGNVGIGTTSPSQKLEINGTILSTDGSFGTLALGAISTRIEGNAATREMKFYTFNSEKMIIDGLGNVGIGNSAPAAPLSFANLTGNKIDFYYDNVSGGDRYGIEVQSSELRIHSGAQGDPSGGITFGKKTATTFTEAMRVANNGNVGIGTTAPQGRLAVDGGNFRFNYGNANTGYYFYLNHKGNQDGGILWTRDNSTFDWQMNNDTNGNFILYSYGAGSTSFLINRSTGNVGIGTTSPQTILQLGEGSLSNATTNQYLRVNAGGYNALSYAHLDLFNFGNNFGNSLGWRLTSATEGVGVSVGRSLSFNTVVTDGSGNPSTASERMRISAAGNVGIGTSSPAYKLDVNGTVNIVGSFGNRGVDAAYRLKFYDNGGVANDAGIGLDGSPGGEQMWFNSLDGFYWSTGTNGEKMRITSSGNVGIGTSTPFQSKVHILKSESGSSPIPVLRIGNQGAGYTSRITLTDETTNDANISYIGSIQSLGFGVGASLSQMIINSNGNVGIGTTSPGNLLNTFIANGAGGFSKGVRISTGNGTYTSGHGGMLEFQNEDVMTAGIRGVRQSGWGSSLLFYVHNTSSGNTFDSTFVERMRINESGNVGIGTTNPISKLHINNASTAATSFLAGNNNGGTYFGWDSDNTGLMATYGNVALKFGGNYSSSFNEWMRITSGGNVGIGTTSPSNALTITKSANSYLLDGLKVDRDPSTTSSSIFNAFGGGTNIISNSGQTSTFSPITFRASDNTTTNELMRITGSGNVGIGTTSPNSLLQVGSSNFVIAGRTSAVYGPLDDNNIFTVGASGTDYPILVNIGVSQTNQYGVISVNQFTSSARTLVLQPNGGDVTVGTTAPLLNTGGRGNVTINGSLESILVLASGGVWKSYLFNDGVGNTYLTSAGVLNFGTGGSDRMRITSSGNVGIGTTSPLLGLNVADGKGFIVGDGGGGGSIYVSPTNSNTINGGYGITNDAGDLWLNYRGYQDGFSYFRDTRIGNGKGAAILMVDGSAGNVGIGTESPGSRLHVETSSSNPFRMVRSGDSSYGFELGSGDAGFYNYGASAYVWFAKANGNLGIGTTSPAANLTVVRNANNASYITTFSNTNAGASAATISEWKVNGYSSFVIGKSNSDGRVEIAQIGNNNIDFINNGTNVMSIDTNQNVMVNGTTAEACAQLEIKSETKGFLPPRMSDADRDNISSPVEGLMIYNTTQKTINFYDGTTWQRVAVV